MWRSSTLQHRLQESEGHHGRFTRHDRIRYSAVVGSAAALLLIARMLRPSVNGVGTHQQLGLPPCAFLHFTGVPCPSCGLTTSVAHAARLRFYESVITQPFGFIIFLIATLSIPLSIYFIHRQVPWPRFGDLRGGRFIAYLMITIFLLSWFYKIAAMKGLFIGG
jgi:hypothetical protein